MKKFVSGMLAAVMALSLAACSGNTDTSSAAQDSQAATSEGSASQATIKMYNSPLLSRKGS